MNIQLESIYKSKIRNRRSHPMLEDMGFHAFGRKLLFPVVLLALSTGMRKGEILGLKWKDIDLETGRITLNHTKNGDRRVVPVQGLALTTLQNLAPPFKNNPTYLEEYVFAGKKGG